MSNNNLAISPKGDKVSITLSRENALDLLFDLRNINHADSTFFTYDLLFFLREFFAKNQEIVVNLGDMDRYYAGSDSEDI